MDGILQRWFGDRLGIAGADGGRLGLSRFLGDLGVILDQLGAFVAEPGGGLTTPVAVGRAQPDLRSA